MILRVTFYDIILYKKKNSKSKVDNVLKGHSVILFNKYEKKEMKDYFIDYNYYISETENIIQNLRDNYQLQLF